MNNNSNNQNNSGVYTNSGVSSNNSDSMNNNSVNTNTNYVNNNVVQTNVVSPSFNNQIQSNNLNSNITNNGNYQQNNQVQERDKKALTLSIINLVVGVPFVVNFGVIWMIFGAFGGETTYYLILGICGAYILFSIVALIKSIWNVIKYNDKAKRDSIVVILTIIGFIIAIYFMFQKYFG